MHVRLESFLQSLSSQTALILPSIPQGESDCVKLEIMTNYPVGTRQTISGDKFRLGTNTYPQRVLVALISC